ncbi:MAG: serine--tRNA ligase [Saprospiraceae bacterium]|nr:serine--tRNA ligase [Saprospiraceae bacterium]
MLQIQTIREKSDFVIKELKRKNFDAATIVDQILSLDAQRKAAQLEHDNLKAEKNAASKEIGQLFKSGQVDAANQLKENMGALGEKIDALVEQMRQFEQALEAELVQLPNIPHSSVPSGNSDEDNEVVFQVEEVPTLDDTALPHWELAAKYQLIDFETGVKLTGSGFPLYTGKGARFQRALISYFLDQATEAGYLEVQPPHLVNEASAFGTGQLPDKEGQMYHATQDNFYLIPTAEVPITNIHRDDLFKEADLPKKYTGYTPCFRREAGSYGKDVRGLNRLHQFDKVEIVQFVLPEQSYDALEDMKNHVEGLLKNLGLPYRILRLCGGDVSFASALTFDFETYSAAQKRWLEVSSVSNFEAFQSNRMKIRYRPNSTEGKAKTQLIHTLNGSALALPRIVATLLENNQSPEGIHVPEVLQPYTGFSMIR